jgi:N-hydroxyarylamine O-acetyltransferase
MDWKKYLQRIYYTGDTSPGLNVLKNLQRSHLLHVPFENLDIHLGRPLSLETIDLFNKIVLNKRGGFCYELNGLFFELLRSLGFRARRISARVFDQGNYGPEFDHLALIVDLPEARYLCDVGFGEFAREPLKMELDRIQPDPGGDYLIDRFDQQYFRVSRMETGEPIPQYIFKNEPRSMIDFESMCLYHQSSPQSHFTRQRLITLLTETGRVTLSGNLLKITTGKDVIEIPLGDQTTFEQMLQEYFGVSI